MEVLGNILLLYENTLMCNFSRILKSLFFFRHYKNLRQGFSLNRPNKLSVFCAKASVQKVVLESPQTAGGAAMRPPPPEGRYIVLELKPMTSAYKNCSKYSMVTVFMLSMGLIR